MDAEICDPQPAPTLCSDFLPNTPLGGAEEGNWATGGQAAGEEEGEWGVGGEGELCEEGREEMRKIKLDKLIELLTQIGWMRTYGIPPIHWPMLASK